ncbi:hypothetical protein [Nitrosococcus wardiae]|uniref:Uncharacterized protein n=1 Tax=Nitrosococcus wardiae TaxID=1814290 RepID=A0A4P7BVX9_9GAMM|nr:hypothetical protein [Nitrosococcus wardiae]QBQ53437.1 hypothetical protein E3U44_02155 [Nitrosococcus wardiae]
MKRLAFYAVGFACLALGIATPGWAEETRCLSISGAIAGSIVGPTSVLGTVTGSLQGATQATITKQEKGEDRVDLELKHIFVTKSRDTLQTRDKALWIPIPGRTGVYHMSTQYKVTGGTGRFAEATGTFKNHGEADTHRGLVTLAYSGQICGVAP